MQILTYTDIYIHMQTVAIDTHLERGLPVALRLAEQPKETLVVLASACSRTHATCRESTQRSNETGKCRTGAGAGAGAGPVLQTRPQLTGILPRGAIGPKNLVVEHPLEVLDREVDGRCNGVSCHGDKLGPVVNGNAAEQACGAYKSERAQRNGKE
jgi:hypothetical protein